MGVMATLRDWFGSPGDPELVDRATYVPAELRAAIGPLVVPPTQLNRPIWQPGTPARYVTEGWGKAPVVFACVLALADAVATAPIVVKDDVGNGHLEPAEDDPLQLLLNRPNPMMDQAEFMQTVQAIAALSGFCVIEKERNGFDEVIGLWPLRSDWLRPVPQRDGAPDWEYAIPGYTTPFRKEADDVIVYTHAPDPNLGYRGTAPMAVAFRELGIENLMTDFLKAFFDRGALPVYGIVTERGFKSQDEADAFRERMVGKYGGALRSADPMLLGGVKDVKRLGFDFDELAYPELRALSETSICTAFRVPPILIGIQAGLDKATYSNYEQARRNFYEDVVTSQWRRIDGALTRSLVPDFDATGKLSIEFDTGDVPALQDDEEKLWQRATAALSAGGISTHAFQRMLDLDPHGPDVIYQPFSATPIPISTNGQRSRASVTIDPFIAGMVEALGEERMLEREARGAARYEVRDGRTYLRFDALPAEERARHARAAQHNRALMGQIAALLEPRLVTFFAEQGERVEAALGLRSAGRILTEQRALTEMDWDNELQYLRTLIEQWFGEAGALMFTELSKQLGTELFWSTGNQYISELMEQLGTRIVGISETTRQQVEAVIVKGLAEGTGVPAIADELKTLFTETYTGRATTVARTESQFAANTAAGAAYQQSGITRAVLYDNPAHSESYGASDGLSCAERNGLVVDVRQIPRHSAGEHPNGTMAVGPVVEGA